MYRQLVLSFFALLMTFLGIQEVKATHIMGADINYECLNQCTIRVHLRAYRDCDPTASTFISATPTTFTPRTTPCTAPVPIQAAWSTAVIQEVTPVCPTIATQCSNPSASIRGVEEFYFWRDYDICAAGNCVFDLNWTTCCRNGAVTSGAANDDIYVSTTLNNTLTNCNSTPYFSNPPVPYICAGQTFTFNQGAVDPDGDSLAYALGPCNATSPTTFVGYNTGYSATSPLGPSWIVNIDSITGDITVSPNPTGSQVVGVLCVFVEEWRNGTMINTIQRDIQMTVINCPSNSVPPISGVTNTSGLIVNSPTNVTTCAGTPICFNIQATDANSGDFLTMYWDQSLTGATFVNAGNPLVTDTITGLASSTPTGRFCWTPPSQGIFSFVITIQDDACPIPGRVQYSITINVNGGLATPTASAALTGNPGNCTEVQFNGSPGAGGTGPFTYYWSGPGNLSLNPNINLPGLSHIYPGPGTYPYTLIVTDAYGCQGVVIDSVVVPNGPTADAGPDIAICSGFSTPVGAPAIAGQTYLWSGTGASGLSSTTAAQPTFSWNNAGPNPDTLDLVVQASSGGCTSIDYVQVLVNPIPVATITPSSVTICDGDTADLVAGGGSNFLWNTGDTTGTIRVSPNSTTNYTLTVVENGCASAPTNITVNVAPGPVAVVSGPTALCPGEIANLSVVGGNNWTWSNGASGSSTNYGPVYQDTTVWVVPSTGTCTGQLVNYTVNVHTPPTADFSFSAACDGQSTSFTDQSNGGSGSVNAWSWNFGDPNSGPDNVSAQQNPSHSFLNPGSYNVTLVTTSSDGCMDTITQVVTVNPLPVVDFSFLDVCEGEVMNFTNNTGGAIGSLSWDFGDGASDNISNPSHTYNGPGAYTVGLTVVDGNGCSNTVVKTAFVHPEPNVAFDWDNSCFNTITTFEDQSTITDPYGTEMALWEWDFGDGNTSNTINPVHNYPPGGYNVTLTVTSTKGCSSSLTQLVRVEEVTPLTPHNDSICKGYSASLMVDNNEPNTEVIWLYDPNSTNPFHIGPFFNTPPLTETTTYYVALRDEDGCISNPQRIVAFTYRNPRIDFTANETTVYVPNAIVEFTGVYQQNYTSIIWDFGDGSSSNLGNPVHQYTEPGVYTVTLSVIDENGCERTLTREEYIEVIENVNLWVPSGFTPNGDGLNDFFEIKSRLVTDLDIAIFNRWGQRVYTAERLDFRWDGKDVNSAKPLPEGVYTYVIKATAYDGSPLQKNGTITLIR